MNQPGDRVRLLYTCNPHTTQQPRDEGAIRFVVDVRTLHVGWDGSRLGFLPGIDAWEPCP